MNKQTFELNNMGFIAMSEFEMKEADGGGFWDHVVGWLVGKGLDLTVEHRKEIEKAWNEGNHAHHEAHTSNWTPVGVGF